MGGDLNSEKCNSLCELRNLYEFRWRDSLKELSKAIISNKELNSKDIMDRRSDQSLSRFIQYNSNFFTESNENPAVYTVNIPIIQRDFLNKYKDERKYCSIFSEEKLSKEINNLPEKIHIFSFQNFLNSRSDNRREFSTDDEISEEIEDEEDFIETIKIQEDQLEILADKISSKLEKVFRDLFKDAKLIKK
ncbi:MAG: hypothetical protein HeimC3_46810 [Candidatus Heimdallarchaeota archaeon LC_3]|nr:MAG: hypothetical protein HeimC3_46810 [Candidatus Heimdallarchaeota archaeon LC_3]